MNFFILLIGNQTIHFSISFAFLQIQHTAMFPIVKNNDLLTFRQCLGAKLLSFLGGPIFFWFEVNRDKVMGLKPGSTTV